MSILSLQNLTKHFGTTVAVDRINLEVSDRELVVLVGPSGCGKTTTLRMIAGLDQATEGSIRIDGRVVNDVPPKDRDIAMVFQNYALYPHLNVYKNMAFGLKMQRTPRAEVERRVRQAAGILGIAALLERKPAELSGGQQQRVALGRAIVRQPRVFLFDEPLSHLDAGLRVAMRSELVKLQRRLETTMLHVTHDQVEAMTMGERIVVMNLGRIQQVGSSRELYDAPANRFVAEFIGSPPMNLLPGKIVLRDSTAVVDLDDFALALSDERSTNLGRWSGQPVALGLRPENIVTNGAREPTGASFRTEVLRVHDLGAETLFDLQCGRHELVARAGSSPSHRPGDVIDVFVDTAKCHLFDPTNGLAIGWASLPKHTVSRITSQSH